MSDEPTQREQHTRETDKVVEIIKEQFLEIQRLNLIIDDLRKRPVWLGSHLSNESITLTK